MILPSGGIVGFTLGAFVAYDAHKHGYTLERAALWGVGTALFWPVAAPLYFLWGRKRKQNAEKERIAETTQLPKDVSSAVECPRCKSDVPDSFTKCPHCGALLKRVCKTCGEPIPDGKTACPRCDSTDV